MNRLIKLIILLALWSSVAALHATSAGAHWPTRTLNAVKTKVKDVCIKHPAGLGNYKCAPGESFPYTFAQRRMSLTGFQVIPTFNLHVVTGVYHVHSGVTGDDETWDVFMTFYHGQPINACCKRKLVD